MRDRCTWVSAATNSASATKSRSETASSEFSNGRENSSALATDAGSSGRLEPASAPAPSGETSARVEAVVPAVDVAGERPEVREQMVREQHRLRRAGGACSPGSAISVVSPARCNSTRWRACMRAATARPSRRR